MDECIEYVAEGGLSSSPLSSQAGTAGMRMHRSKLGNQTQKRPHQIFTEINSSQAPCEASRLSSVLWEYTESTEQQLCSQHHPAHSPVKSAHDLKNICLLHERSMFGSVVGVFHYFIGK